jgi:hypothetical protein
LLQYFALPASEYYCLWNWKTSFKYLLSSFLVLSKNYSWLDSHQSARTGATQFREPTSDLASVL